MRRMSNNHDASIIVCFPFFLFSKVPPQILFWGGRKHTLVANCALAGSLIVKFAKQGANEPRWSLKPMVITVPIFGKTITQFTQNK